MLDGPKPDLDVALALLLRLSWDSEDLVVLDNFETWLDPRLSHRFEDPLGVRVEHPLIAEHVRDAWDERADVHRKLSDYCNSKKR